MNSESSLIVRQPFSRVSRFLLAFTCALAAGFTTGCGSGVSQPPGSGFTGNTSVTVLASSTANDQLSQFGMVFGSLTLTSQSGTAVSVFAAPLHAEFIHANGTTEPLATVTVPQGVYTSATASIGQSGFACINLNSSGGIDVSDFADQLTPSSNVTVNFPAPVTVTGASLVLSLDLVVSKSASYTTCDTSGIDPYSVTPTFNLVPVAIASQPTSSENGKENGLEGQIASVDTAGSSFKVTAADGPSWQVAVNDSTVFQGITGVSNLAVGMPVDMDATIRPDGSLLATRVAVEDTDTANLTVSIGPLLGVFKFEQGGVQYTNADVYGRVGWGNLLAASASTYSFGNSVFQTSGAFTNLQNLPFPASFTATNMVAGQNVFISAHALNISPEPIYIPATTITLLPQTINGTVSAVSNEGGFATYIVVLAPYDLFPDLAVQTGQTTLLTNPNSVVVYVDSNARLLNSSPLAAGSVVRFNGLVFNDNGTLRMDCAQVSDGVAE